MTSNQVDVGHRIQLLYRSTEATAARIAAELRDNSILTELRDAGVKVVLVCLPEDPPRPDIEGTSDRNWPDAIQHAWLLHLNAIFGYRPLVLREERLSRI